MQNNDEGYHLTSLLNFRHLLISAVSVKVFISVYSRHFHRRHLFLTITVKILKIGTPEIITIIVLQLEQLDFTVQYRVKKMQTE